MQFTNSSQFIYGSTTGLAYVTGSRYQGLANNAMTDEQRATLVPGSEEYTMRVKGSKIQLINWLDYILLLWLLKTCMALFYSRLTSVSCLFLLLFSKKPPLLIQM